MPLPWRSPEQALGLSLAPSAYRHLVYYSTQLALLLLSFGAQHLPE